MRRALPYTILGMAVLMLGTARGDESAAKGADQDFVTNATEGGLAEVNVGDAAVKQASNADVKQFAQKMVEDHTKANKELLALADKKSYKVAATMNAEHDKMAAKLAKLSGAAFDRAYMAGQVKDHEKTIALFEKESKGGKDKELKAWAKKMLPDLKMHLKNAKEVRGRLKES